MEINSLKVKISEDSRKFEELHYMEEELSKLTISYKLVITQSEKYKSEISSLKVKMSDDAHRFEELQYMEEEISRLS